MNEAYFCPACGHVDNSSFFTLGTFALGSDGDNSVNSIKYSLIGCKKCSSHFSWPRVSVPDTWHSTYTEYYGWRWEFTEVINDFNQCLSPGNKILEIGCGEGLLLQALAEKYDAYGVDLNKQAIQHAESKNLKAFNLSLAEFQTKFGDSEFYGAIMFNVIEHLEDPLSLLIDLKKSLHKGAHILISIPNMNRTGVLIGWEPWDYPPHHLTRFSSDGIDSLIIRAGFAVVSKASSPKETVIQITSATANRIIEKAGVSVSSIPPALRYILKAPLMLLSLPVALYDHAVGEGDTIYVHAVLND